MKKSKITLIIVPVAVALGFITHLANSYDFAPSTTENQFGIQANLAYVKDLKISCPIAPCGPFNAFMFKYTAQKPVQLIGYNICGGIFCIKHESSSYGLGGNETHPFWGGSETVGQIPWKIGDAVHIRVKVKPVIVANDGEVIPQDEIFFIDVGESKIIEVEDR